MKTSLQLMIPFHKTWSSFGVKLAILFGTHMHMPMHMHDWVCTCTHVLMLLSLSCPYVEVVALIIAISICSCLMPWVAWSSKCICSYNHMFYSLSLACLTWHVDLHLGLRYEHIPLKPLGQLTLYPIMQQYLKASYSWAGMGKVTSSYLVP